MRAGIGGLNLYRRPVGLCRRLIAEGAADLDLVGLSLSWESDLLIREGRVRSVRTSYFGLEIFGLAPAFSRAAAEGRLQVHFESEVSLCAGLWLALGRDPGLTVPVLRGTDLDRPLSPIQVDLALLHAPWMDADGNAWFQGNPGVDLELAELAPRVAVSYEEEGRAPESPVTFRIPAEHIDERVKIPRGAAPTSCHPLYPIDARAILQELRARRA